MSDQGSFIHVGSEAWSVWSDSTNELLSLKLPKFILVLIGRCQNTQCIKVCCVGGYTTADQSRHPC